MSEPPPPDSPRPEKEEAAPPKTGGWMMMAGGWMLAMLAATMFFNGILADRQNPNRLASLDDQQGDLILEANHYGQYLAEGRINGSEVTFLLDTGATVVAVPRDIAALAGLSEGAEVSVATAAGTAAARRTRIRRLSLGPFVFKDLRAVVIPSDPGAPVLLGMNALRSLTIAQQDSWLILSPVH